MQCWGQLLNSSHRLCWFNCLVLYVVYCIQFSQLNGLMFLQRGTLLISLSILMQIVSVIDAGGNGLSIYAIDIGLLTVFCIS